MACNCLLKGGSLPLVVTTTNDLVNPGGGQVSLRSALAYAQTNGGTPTITFSPALAGQTVVLTNIGDGTFGPSALLVTNTVTIDGGTNGIVISQGIGGVSPTGGMRIFYITSNGNLTLKNLTVSGGLAQGGSSFYGGGAAGLGGMAVNAGALQLVQCTLTANRAFGGGSGIGSGTGGGGLGGNNLGDYGGGGPNGGESIGGEPNSGAGGFGGGGGYAEDGGHGVDGGYGGGGGFNGYGRDGLGVTGNGGFGGGGGSYGFGGYGGGDGSKSLVDGGTRQGDGGGGGGFGGAVFNYGGTVFVTNSTLAGNLAIGGNGGSGASNGSGYGGAIFNLNGSVSTLNATIASNTAPQGGGAIYSLGDNGVATQSGPALPGTVASITLNNTIMAGSTDGANPVADFIQNTNDSGNGGGFGSVISSGGYNLIVSNAVNQAFAGGIISSNNPLLGLLANNGGPTPTMALLAGSPAFSSGSLALAAGLTTDQRGTGYARVLNGQVSLGAYALLTVPTLTTLVSTSNPSFFGQPVTFTATVTGGQGIPSGTVNFYDGATNFGSGTLTNGSVSLTNSTLSVGSHNIQALYTGNGLYMASTGLVSQTVLSLTNTSEVWTPSLVVTNGTWFRQTSLMRQYLTLTNVTSQTLTGVRVTVQLSPADLAAHIVLYNASGTNGSGQSYLQHNYPVPPGGTLTLAAEFYSPNRVSIPHPTYTVTLVTPVQLVAPAGTPQNVLRQPVLLADHTFLIDFLTVKGASYYIQYSQDVGGPWNVAQPPVVGTGYDMQWVDDGPPKTMSAPASVPSRIYRIIKAN